MLIVTFEREFSRGHSVFSTIINEAFLLEIYHSMLKMTMFEKFLKNVETSKVKKQIFELHRNIRRYCLGVRLIRDRATSAGKGFGYVLFKVNYYVQSLKLSSFSRRMKHQLP